MAGDLMMLLSMISAAFGSIFIKKCTMQVSPLVVTAYSHLLASVTLLIIGFFANPVWSYAGAFAPWPLFILLFSSFICTAMGAFWWNTGIQRVGASTSSLFQNGIPIVGVFASALFLAEELQWNHFAALVLVLAGVSLGAGVVSFGRWLQDAPDRG